MAHTRVDRLCMACGGAVAAAVVRCTEKGTALDHLARNAHGRIAVVMAVGLTAAAGIYWDAACLRRIGGMPSREPIRGPLPDIADHVVEAVAVRRKASDRRCPRVAVAGEVFVRKRALPGIRHMAAAGREFLAPCKLGPIEAAACGVFPLGFRRQFLARPGGIGFGVCIRNVHHRVIVETLVRSAPTVRTPPICTELKAPPLRPVPEVDRVRWRCEDQRARFQHVRQGAWIVLRVRRYLGDGDIAGGLDKLAELTVSHRIGIDKETIDPHAVRWRLFRVMLVGAHPELATLEPYHIAAVMRRDGPISGNHADSPTGTISIRAGDGLVEHAPPSVITDPCE